VNAPATFPALVAERQPSSCAQELTFARENIEWAARQVRRAGEPEIETALLAIAGRIAGMELPAIHALGCERCNGDVPLDLPRFNRERLCPSCIAEAKASRRRKPAVAASIGASLDRMVAVQIAAYPDHWTSAEKREMAEQHLFGREVHRD
jgi:hypothetical protein